MTESVGKVEWKDLSEAFPAFVTLIATPLTFSIATGLSLGVISYTVAKVAAGKFREVSVAVGANGALSCAVRVFGGGMRKDGAQERTRTSTTVRPLAPEASASASSATWAQVQSNEVDISLRLEWGFVNEPG